MPRNLLHLGWEDFDIAVSRLWYQLQGVEAVGVYGEPRGGLPLAVALSHRLGLPLLTEPCDGMIWVDDICDSGKTANAVQHRCAAKAVWVAIHPNYTGMVHAYVIIDDHPWIVFPWEDAQKAEQERENYLATRE